MAGISLEDALVDGVGQEADRQPSTQVRRQERVSVVAEGGSAEVSLVIRLIVSHWVDPHL